MCVSQTKMEFYNTPSLNWDGVLSWLSSKLNRGFTRANLELRWDFTQANIKPTDLLHRAKIRNQDEILHKLISNQQSFYTELSVGLCICMFNKESYERHAYTYHGFDDENSWRYTITLMINHEGITWLDDNNT